jgi:thymidylate synthase ThyX
MATHIKAEVVLKSVNKVTGDEITTFLLQYPRVIHSELMTHRLLSPYPEFAINTASSRAVPVKKWIAKIKEQHYIPPRWLKNQKGMTALNEEVDNPVLMLAFYEQHMHKAIEIADVLASHGVSKQIVNRILEPFQIIQCVVTATQWNNFYSLRDSLHADPLIQELAQAMKIATKETEGKVLNTGQWHLPFVSRSEEIELGIKDAILVSAARCARVSYLLNPDEPPRSIESDLELAARLITSGHYSPLEHPAFCYPMRAMVGSYIGFAAARKFLDGEDGDDIPNVNIYSPRNFREIVEDFNPFL